MRRLTTKPDCSSLFSTLQSAHWPVRGQPTAVGAPTVAASGADNLTPLVIVAVEDADPALSDEGRVHAAKAAEASTIRTGSFLIELKDRRTGRAMRPP